MDMGIDVDIGMNMDTDTGAEGRMNVDLGHG